jgi:hypothetical protein
MEVDIKYLHICLIILQNAILAIFKILLNYSFLFN